MINLINPDLSSFAFFELTPDLVCIAGKDGLLVKANQAVQVTLQYTEAELLSIPVKDLIHPEDRDRTSVARNELLNGKTLTNFENRYVAKDGSTIWLEWTSIYLPDKEVVFAIAKNVTERKVREIAIEKKILKFKNLATNFKKKIEKDRKYFAVEVQEELAQLAAVVKMSIAAINTAVPDASGQLKQKIEHAFVVAGLLINTIKRVSFNIGPYILDDIGLEETLRWFCKEFSLLHDIPCEFTGTFNEKNLTHEMKIDFLRICQEALSNVIRHSAAGSVQVSIKEKNKQVQLCITDNGKGFVQEELKKTMGLTIMEDLSTSIDGTLSIESEPGKGTTICIAVATPQ